MNPTLHTAIDELVALEERVLEAPTDPFGFGSDLHCSTDLTEAMDEVDPFSLEALSDAIIRRLDTARGALPDDPDYGLELRAYLNRGTTDTELRAIESQVAGELGRDDRIDAATVAVTFAPDGSAMTCRVSVTPVAPRLGGFSLTLAVTSASIVLEEMARA